MGVINPAISVDPKQLMDRIKNSTIKCEGEAKIPKINQNKVMLCKINSGDDIEYGDVVFKLVLNS